MKDDVSKLRNLGSQGTDYQYQSPFGKMLETFPNRSVEPHKDEDGDELQAMFRVVHTFPEFTSLCPKTGQPDFATIKVCYSPDEQCVETKSLKLYLFAYRQEGSFMETICNQIRNDLVAAMQPHWIRVSMVFGARGGIQTTVDSYWSKSCAEHGMSVGDSDPKALGGDEGL